MVLSCSSSRGSGVCRNRRHRSTLWLKSVCVSVQMRDTQSQAAAIFFFFRRGFRFMWNVNVLWDCLYYQRRYLCRVPSPTTLVHNFTFYIHISVDKEQWDRLFSLLNMTKCADVIWFSSLCTRRTHTHISETPEAISLPLLQYPGIQPPGIARGSRLTMSSYTVRQIPHWILPITEFLKVLYTLSRYPRIQNIELEL